MLSYRRRLRVLLGEDNWTEPGYNEFIGVSDIHSTFYGFEKPLQLRSSNFVRALIIVVHLEHTTHNLLGTDSQPSKTGKAVAFLSTL